MQSSSHWLFGLALGTAALRGAIGCGTEPCFRHSDCASSEVCSSGQCVLAPVDTVLPDDGGANDAAATNDAGTTVVDVSMPVVDSGGPLAPETDEMADEVTAEAGGDADSGDSAGE